MAIEGVDRVIANLRKWADGRGKAAEEAMRDVTTALEGWARGEHPGPGRVSIRGEVAEASDQIVRGMISAEMSAKAFQKLVRAGKWSWLWPVLLKHESDILKILAARLGGPGEAPASAGGSGMTVAGSEADDGSSTTTSPGMNAAEADVSTATADATASGTGTEGGFS